MSSTTAEHSSQLLGEALLRRGWHVATAESCTGGSIAERITAVPGSSRWFQYGFVTYSNLAKQKLLAVPADLLEGADAPGAVSGETVAAMARGALKVSGADLAVASSGVAGPGGGSVDKPVGTVWLGWSARQPDSPDCQTRTQCFHFEGDRATVRQKTVESALAGLLDIVNNHPDGLKRTV